MSGRAVFVLVGLVAGCQFNFDEDRLDDKCAGKSDSAECCKGCWDGKKCQTGDSPTACGVDGNACAVCSDPADVCDPDIRQCVTERAVVSIGAGSTHTCAADRTYTLWCWGDNTAGQAARDLTTPESKTPFAASTGEWVEVASGGTTLGHSCAIHHAGSIWCWGDNASGQLGTGNTNPNETRPTVIGDESWKHVTAGDAFSCAINQTNSLWCWGDGGVGQLGAPQSSSNVPLRVGVDSDWSDLDAGGKHACAVKQAQNASIWCWGDNSKGQLGRSGNESQPGLVDTGYVAVSAGTAHTCGIRNDKTLWCWGDNSRGQLGLSDAGPVTAPKQVGTDANWTAIAAGNVHTCGLREDSTLYCWGDNTHGQIGKGASTSIPEPVTLVPGRDDWAKLASGADHVCAVTRQGLLFCWGRGDRYQTGLNVSDDVKAPTAVTLKVP